MGERFCDGIESIERLLAAHPQDPGAVFEKAADIHATKAVRSAGLVLEHFKRVPIVSVESIFGGDPHEAEFVWANRETLVWDKPSVTGSRLNRISKPSIKVSLLVRLSTRTCGTLLEASGGALGCVDPLF